MLTVENWITSSNKYPERAKSIELTDDVKANAAILIAKVNALLSDLGVSDKLSVSSGFRPSSVNSGIANAAKRSAHMSGKAIDIVDLDGKLKGLVASRPDLLRTHELFMEDSGSTPTWMHLDFITRVDRPTRTFKP